MSLIKKTMYLIFFIITSFGSFYLVKIYSEKNTQISLDARVEKLRVGFGLQPTSMLTILAIQNGYFKRHNLDIIVHHYPSGKRALKEGLKSNTIDIASTADIGFWGQVNAIPDMKIITALTSNGNLNRIVAREDSGITSPHDLIGKKIATQSNSAVHFFLHRFLDVHEIHRVTNQKIIFMKAEQLVDALKNKRIDAFSMREPFISQAKKVLGDKAIIFDAPGIYEQYGLLVAKEGYLKSHKNAIIKYLLALNDAKNYYLSHKEYAQHIIAEYLGADIQVIQESLEGTKCLISLNDPLRILLGSQYAWMSKEVFKQVEKFDIDYYIDSEPMESLFPQRVYKNYD